MQQMFFEIVAQWIMQLQVFKDVFGTTMGGLNPVAPGAAGGAAAAQQGGVGGAIGSILRGSAPWSHSSSSRGAAAAQASPGIGSESDSSDGGYVPQFGVPAPTSFMGGNSFVGGGSASSGLGGVISAAGTIGGGGIPGYSGSIPGMGGTVPTFPGSSSPSVSSAAAGPNSVMGLAGAGMGAYSLVQDTRSAFDKGNPLQGAIGDAGGQALQSAPSSPAWVR